MTLIASVVNSIALGVALWLGLYIVRQVVRAHGGTISVLDNKPQGTVFVVEV